MPEPRPHRRTRALLMGLAVLAALPLALPERRGTDDAARTQVEAWRGAPVAAAWTSPWAPTSRREERWRFAAQATLGAALLAGVVVALGRRRA